VICEKTTTLIILDLELVHHFIDRKLVIQSLYIFQANPTLAHFILVTGHVLWTTHVMVEVEVKLNYDRQSVGQSILVSSSHLKPMTRLLFSVWQLQVSCCGAPSLTRGWVCNLLIQLLLGLARAITLGFKSLRTQTIFYCLIWDSPNLDGQVPIFISPRNRVAQLYPLALDSLTTCRVRSGYGYITANSQSVSMSWCLAQSRTMDQSLLSPWNFI
jgi:hypothetical protein